MIDDERNYNGETKRFLEAKKLAGLASRSATLAIMAINDPMEELVRRGYSAEQITKIRFKTVLRSVLDGMDFNRLETRDIHWICSAVAVDIGHAMGIPMQVGGDVAEDVADGIIEKMTCFDCGDYY